MSTRRVDEIAQAMGLTGISKSQVSKLCKEIDERVKAFLERPLEGDWPYLWLDATYLKVREGGRIVSVAAIIAVAANTEGRREIVGLGIGPSKPRRLLGGLPEAPDQTRPARRQARDLGRARRAERPPSSGSSARHGNAVACAACAMRWPTCQRRRRRLSPPPSARPSSSPTARRRARSGGTSPISCGPGSRNSAG